ncbi:MAG: isoprenylcysteine carboxylmethyltransferase family protein [Deltaproteobacteria bacterium]|nr:isoprenylcysteine carboxylmethyltransferase family protein [Deltaproteobacteria bacterium]
MKPASIALGSVFLGTVFILAPAGAIQLNEACDWPRWQIPGGRLVGAGLVLAGIAVALYCSGLFSRIGRGTPVPIQPPEHLVIAGLYRYSRNPMYVAHVAILLGLFLYRGELSLVLYTAIYMGWVRSWVVWREEPELRRRFGEEYARYTQQVSRWLPSRLHGAGD